MLRGDPSLRRGRVATQVAANYLPLLRGKVEATPPAPNFDAPGGLGWDPIRAYRRDDLPNVHQCYLLDYPQQYGALLTEC